MWCHFFLCWFTCCYRDFSGMFSLSFTGLWHYCCFMRWACLGSFCSNHIFVGVRGIRKMWPCQWTKVLLKTPRTASILFFKFFILYSGQFSYSWRVDPGYRTSNTLARNYMQVQSDLICVKVLICNNTWHHQNVTNSFEKKAWVFLLNDSFILKKELNFVLQKSSNYLQ